MEPLTTATTFATIVGLIGNFAAERRNSSSANFEEFIEWLVITNHQELAKFITQNHQTSISIKALLSQGQAEVVERLQRLDSSLAQLATGFDDFRAIALATYPGSELSDQAISILQQFVASGGSKILCVRLQRHLALYAVDGGSGQLQYDDARFIEDDLDTLVQFGLLRLDYNKRGEPFYVITRNATRFIEGRSSGI